MTVTWYNGSTQLATETYTITGSTFFAEKNVTGYNKVVATFDAMTRASRFLKIYSISDGISREFYKEEIISLDILECMNQNNIDLSANEVRLKLLPANTLGVVFQRTLPMKIYRKRYGNWLLWGKYYITDVETNRKENTYTIKLGDAISLLQYQTFLGGQYSNTNVSTIINSIFSGSGFSVTFNSAVSGLLGYERITGYLPMMNKREALRQVLLASGYSIDASRSGSLVIRNNTAIKSGTSVKKMSLNTKDTYYDDEVFDYKKNRANIVTRYEYKLKTLNATASSSQVLYSGTLNGTTTIYFSSPVYNLSISNGTIDESNINYATITGTGSTVTLSGKTYEASEKIYSRDNPNAIATDLPRTEVQDATIYCTRYSTGSAGSSYYTSHSEDFYKFANENVSTELIADYKSSDYRYHPIINDGVKISSAMSSYYRVTELEYNLLKPTIKYKVLLEDANE